MDQIYYLHTPTGEITTLTEEQMTTLLFVLKHQLPHSVITEKFQKVYADSLKK
jgi:hypothetical protein